ncbi:MAG TPA: apolipoprotein N-acyltransferase [Usitatibacter sp.]|nr:apolipoprotein N-acyltransferase [Usitatibacter sp.]
MTAVRVPVSAIAGAACVFGFAPFYAWPVPIVALALVFHLWSRSATPRDAALCGFAFGLGYFLAGVSWVYVSLHDFGGMPLPLAALATLLFCGYLALFPALTGWAAMRFAPATAIARVFFAAAAFPGFEWIRGWLFTGFPWLTVGTSQVPDGPLAHFAPYAGAYGTSLAVTLVAASLAALFVAGASARGRIACAAAIAVIFAGALAAGIPEFTHQSGKPVTMALLQGNIAQELKWRDDMRVRTLEAYRRMIFDANARIVVIPETALPAFLDELPPDYLESLRAHAREANKDILLGTVERRFRGNDYEYFNSLVNITAAGGGAYRKRHLVPFGEFIPTGFHWVLAILHIPLSDFSRGDASQPALTAAGLRFGVAICYEDIFGEELIRQLPAAQILVNVSNDAWFGKSLAAEQHLQASQMRALETGRWMVRSTNTGASAAIDETGHVVSRLPPFTAGTLIERVVPYEGLTPYARWGNAPPVVAIVVIVLVLAWRRRAA